MKIYTDGSSYLVDNVGGFAVAVCDDNDNVLYTIGKRYSGIRYTNNMGELSAVLVCLRLYGKTANVTVYSDSAYTINSLNTWMWSWANKSWRKSDNKPIENENIIKEYYKLRNMGYNIKLEKVKAHSGIAANELADKIAKGERKADIQL